MLQTVPRKAEQPTKVDQFMASRESSHGEPFMTQTMGSYNTPNNAGGSPVTPLAAYLASPRSYSPPRRRPIVPGSSTTAWHAVDPQAPMLLEAVAALGPARHARRQRIVHNGVDATATSWDPSEEEAARVELDEKTEQASLQQRNKERLAEIQTAATKKKEEKWERFIADQVEDKIQWLVDRHTQKSELLGKRPGVLNAKRIRATERLNTQIIRAWRESHRHDKNNQNSVLRGGYGDVPIATADGPPRIMPHFSRDPTWKEACLRCAAERMECSMTTVYPGRAVDDNRGCSRCVRAGRACLVKAQDAKHKCEERVWRYVGGPAMKDMKTAREEEKAEVRELLRKRDRIERVFVGGEVVDAQIGNFVCPTWC